jgi:hypothetical protein
VTTRVDRHIQALRDVLIADHEEYIAEVQSLAERAAARGDVATQRWHLDDVERLKAMPFPWEGRSE